jgi:protein transport protein DSL1/ZW10
MPLKTPPHPVSVRDSTTVLTLSSILSSSSATSLSNHLAVLRRDINTYYIDQLLTQPASLTHSSAKDSCGISSETLSFLPSPSTSEDLSMRLKNLTSVLDFLDARLFAALPSSHVSSFKRTLCKPVTTALLQQFLVSLLPSSLAALPPYLHLVTEAKELEEKYIIGMLGQDPRDREVKSWTDAVSSHYERKRRAQILENARQMILRGDNGVLIRVEVDLSVLPTHPPPSSAPATQSSGSGSEGAGEVSDDAWGLEGEESGDTDDLVSAAEEEDAWGFDDGPAEHEHAKPGASPESPPQTDTLAESELATPVDDAAWGWDDNGEEAHPPANTSPQASSSDNSADWDDDPWGESSSNPSALPSAPTSVPKPASRLEKLANKAKAKAPPLRTPSSAMNPPAAAARPPLPAPSKSSKPVEMNNVTLPGQKKEPKSITQADSYTISNLAQQLADTVDAILNEGEEFGAATIFDSKASPAQARGLVILQTAPAVLDLFRALNPVKFNKQPTEPKSIVFANDCIYARGRALGAARQCSDGAKDRLLETAESLNALGKRWFEQSIVSIWVFLIFYAQLHNGSTGDTTTLGSRLSNEGRGLHWDSRTGTV